ncbi:MULTISPECIES: cytidylate kinase-like family protein [Methylococcus]|uniref:Cytidylate kinase-like family protein n=1 Tax=Methylococcus capsulatus TaxID=414 RepID=A0ABZ2F6W4_METCP|nr:MULTISPECIES: cytidylate kinase-like family protein [Methylococcus]MDF9392895.1 cytidylate kinase-like family protein [Methylococcus capsulatus]
MTSSDTLKFLESILAKDFKAEHHRRQPRKRAEPLVITLSRDFGAGGEALAAELARFLDLPIYDKEILDRVAQKTRIDKIHLEHHDEDSAERISDLLYNLAFGTAATRHDYRRALIDVVTELAKSDCIIVGRGAHLILAGRKVFRLRVVGSRPVCGERIAAELGIAQAEAERLVFETNNKRHKSVQTLFSDLYDDCSLERAINFDLVLNTDHLPPAHAMPVILLAVQQFGFEIFDLQQRAAP